MQLLMMWTVPEAAKHLIGAVNSSFKDDSPESEKYFLRPENLFPQYPL
jgi:hypothetical protein